MRFSYCSVELREDELGKITIIILPHALRFKTINKLFASGFTGHVTI